jgi:hypothetical protein
MRRTKAPTWIIPATILVMVTLLCFAAVEGFYWYLGSRLVPQDPGRATRSQPIEPAVTTQQSTPPSPPTAETVPTGPDDQAAPPIPTTSSIVRRNLFASRVGDAGSLPQQDLLAALAASSQEVVLMGTITGPQDEQRAIIYDKRSGRQDLYAEGDYLEQAVIKQILRGKVILSVGGRDELLDITEARTVTVPQVSIPLPVTTSEQVSGRPVGAEPHEEQQPQQQPAANDASRIIIPPSDNPQVLRTIRK